MSEGDPTACAHDELPRGEPSELAFGDKRQMFEDLAARPGGEQVPSKLTEANLRSGLAHASTRLKDIKKLIRKSRVAVKGRLRQGRAERQEALSMVSYVEGGWPEPTEREVLWMTAVAEAEAQEKL